MSLQSDFRQADEDRQQVLVRARDCAAFTIPTILPDTDINEDQDIVRPFQSLGAAALSNIVSKLLLAIFPSHYSWFRYKPVARVKSDRAVSPGMLRAFEGMLYARELQINSYMETTRYRPRMRTILEHVIAIGNALGQVLDNGRIAIHRFDHFVQRRNAGGDLLWTMTKEKQYITELSDEDLAKADVRREDIERKDEKDRTLDLYTRCRRDRADDKTWLIEQEINEHLIRGPSEETVTPYLTVGYIENTGDNYSRSFVEERLGALRSYNGLCEALLDFAVASANIWPAIDPADPFLKPSHLSKSRGKVLTARVVNGVVQGAGYVKMDKYPDFRVVFESAKRIEETLGKDFLLETEAQPTGDRVTATQIMRIARQLEGALGGVYSEIAGELQLPYHDRIVYQLERDNKLVRIPDRYKSLYEVEVLTGVEALGRQVDVERVRGAIQELVAIPGALERINIDALVELVFKGYGVDLQDLLKSAEQVQAERAAAQAEALQMSAGEQAVKSAGTLVEQTAAQQAPANA